MRRYLQLFRIPNVFTAIADVTMGMVFVRRGIDPWPAWVAMIAASALLYTSGMVLNDVYDFDTDLRERPQRPLPSGQIPLARARRLGFILLAVGIAVGWLVGCAVAPPIWMAWRCGLIACSLALCIWLYDAVLKGTVIGPFAMGSCRTLNVLLGMSIGDALRAPESLLVFPTEQLMVAGGIGIYVVGVTWFSRSEATLSRRATLALGMAFMVAGLVMLAVFPRWAAPGLRYSMDPMMIWPFAVMLLMLSTLRRCAMALQHPSPQRVQAAVRQCLFSLIFLDAGICLLIAPWAYAVGVLALLVPTLAFSRWIYST